MPNVYYYTTTMTSAIRGRAPPPSNHAHWPLHEHGGWHIQGVSGVGWGSCSRRSNVFTTILPLSNARALRPSLRPEAPAGLRPAATPFINRQPPPYPCFPPTTPLLDTSSQHQPCSRVATMYTRCRGATRASGRGAGRSQEPTNDDAARAHRTLNGRGCYCAYKRGQTCGTNQPRRSVGQES